MDQSVQALWQKVDDLICKNLIQAKESLTHVQDNAKKAGLPDISVAPNQGKFLHILVKVLGAKRILELGTLAGYSAIWMARALPDDGKLISLEYDPRHAEVAQENIRQTGLESKVEIRIGAALDLLPKVMEEFGRSFDLVFIDANKDDMPSYFEWALKLTRSGGLIISDNVVQQGEVANDRSTSPGVIGVQELLSAASKHEESMTTAIQTVGSKGHDGFAMTLVD